MTSTLTEPTTTTTTTTRLDEETRRVLARAKGIIANGWCQGAYGRDIKGNEPKDLSDAVTVCVVGALAIASGERYAVDYDWDHPLIDLLARSAGALFISDWNDAPGRTQADVIDLFDKALNQ